ncbi:MarR family winged helix-turn-helix transcriptional regulator [Shewanella loihica]|uniref:Transcriptional regulator, MarR family n=1 Tax=Shewanella loihica (strain ATCC BAA-1088 / PV-4) TaxID=323850 RepID=A3QHR6_SHELP|nr:MarR family transcriptional regulator [Shewanella loihica]ABO25014.1 transcriptional regulator, MarR family [Shewanella loihica PV-4]
MKASPAGRLFTEIVLEVFKLSGQLTTEGDKLTQDVQMSSARWKVLGALGRAGNPMTVSDVAHSMGQSRQGVQRLANEMVELGFIALADNPQHKKAKLLLLTDKGVDVLQQLEQKQLPWAEACAQGIDAEALQVTLDTLRKLERKL